MLNAPASPGTAAVPAEDIPQLQERLLGLADAGLTADEYFCGWFRGAPPEAIRRGNVEDFVAYGFHARPLADLSQQARPLKPLLSFEVQWTLRCHSMCRGLVLRTAPTAARWRT